MPSTRPTYDQLLQRIHTLEVRLAESRFGPIEVASQGIVRNGRDTSFDPSYQYDRIFQNHALGILFIGRQSRIVQANRKALQILGYNSSEITQMTTSDLLHPEDANAQPIISIDGLAEDRTMTLERHYRCKDGRYLPVQVHLTALSHDIMMAVFQDISQHQGAEEALRKANEALNVVYNSATAAIVGLDRQSRVTFWNPAAEKLFGLTREEVIGKLYPAVPEECCEAVMAGRSFNFLEIRRKRKDDSFFHAVASVGPLRNEKKEVNGLIAIMFDITQRKQAEGALKQSEQLYRSLVENTQDGYFISEWPSGRFRFLNRRICEMLGCSQKEGLALTLWDIIEAEDQNALKAVVDRRLKSEKGLSLPATFRANRKDGTHFRAEISSATVTFEDQPAIQGLLRDVTETARLQAQLQQAQRLESIGTLAGGVAHDFNNILMAILGNTTLAKLGLEPKHPIYERLENIVTYVQDASDLTKQLLEFARGGKYEVKATGLNSLVEKTAQMFGRAKKELSIYTAFEPDLWTVEVDRGQIEQVLLNLLVNAWQAMPDGGRIDIATRNAVIENTYSHVFGAEPGKYACISVADSGIGMDREVQSKIFEPFFTTKDRGRGTGLGLASAYGIIKNHDGIINVYSEKGKGAKFTIYLPAVERKVVTESPAASAKVLPGSEKILLVDDEQMILEVGQAILIELGYHPLLAHSGEEALNIYAGRLQEIDLVILDMIMPGMSGGETFDRLKTMNTAVKVLLSSGYSLSGEAAGILARGCNGFIQKPFNMEDLSRRIREVLDGDTCAA
jgi:two-component system, cell cycle sensor histidine kinase and response regulator CckA